MAKTLLIMLLVQLLSCTSSRPEASPAPALDPVPPDFRIVIGEGGGFAGLVSGYTVAAGGDILEWKGKTAEQDLKRVGALDPDTLQALWTTVSAGKFLEYESTTASANYTRMITITAKETTRRFEWAVAVKQDSTPASIVGFRSRCLEAVRGSLHR